MRIKKGLKVKWNDPAIDEYDEDEIEDAMNRVFEVVKVSGEIITISDGYSEAEVTRDELEIIK